MKRRQLLQLLAGGLGDTAFAARSGSAPVLILEQKAPPRPGSM